MTGVKRYTGICRNYYLSAEDREWRDNRASIPGPRTQARISQGLPVIATQPAKEKPDVRKESVSLAGPGLILVRLRGTKHASANLRLPIANAKGFSLSSGAERLHVRMIAALIVAALSNRYYILSNTFYPFSLVLILYHVESLPPPRDNVPSVTSPYYRSGRSPSHLLAYPHTHTPTYIHMHTYDTYALAHTHARDAAAACDYRSTGSSLAEGSRKIAHPASHMQHSRAPKRYGDH